MPSTTLNYGLPYPEQSDPADVAGDLQSLAISVDTELLNTNNSVSSLETSVSNDINLLEASVDSLKTNVVYTTTSISAQNNSLIICNNTSPITISLPTSPQEDNIVRIYRNGTGSVSISSSSTINGQTSINSQNSGVSVAYTSGAWWCLPLSSSQPETKGWTRPADWITVPELINGESVVYAILPVYSGIPNLCWLVAENDYTVDWGDGTAVESFSSGVAAYHEYDWADIDPTTLTSDGFYQVLIEVRPQSGETLTKFAGTNSASFMDDGIRNSTTVYTRFIEIKATSPDFVRIPAAIPSWHFSPISLILKYSNQITDTYINSWAYTGGYAIEMEYLYLELPQCTILNPRFIYECKIKEVHFVIPNVTIMEDFIYECPNLTKLTFETTGSLINAQVGYCVRRDAEITITNTSNVEIWQFFASLELNHEDSGTWTKLDGIDFSSATNLNRFYAYCYTETSLPSVNMSGATNVDYLFQWCAHLLETPALNLPNATSANLMFENCSSLRRSNITGMRCTHSYEYCQLVASELNNMYTNLGTALSGATITVTGNPGVTGDNPQIAIDKGWTVIG